MSHQVWVIERRSKRGKKWRVYCTSIHKTLLGSVRQMKRGRPAYDWRIRKYVPEDRDD